MGENMGIKLIAVDLDGTLLNSEQKITSETKAALQRADKKGIKIVPCSGRPFPGVQEYLTELNLQDNDQYAVTFNGALVFNLDGKVIVKDLLHYQDFINFYNLAQEYNMLFHFELENNFVTLSHEIGIYLSRESWLTRMPISIKSFEEIPKNVAFTKAMYSGNERTMLDFREKLPDEIFQKYNVATSDKTLIEINSRTASKGNALKELATELGIKNEEIMIFGDQRNDISMFSEPEFKKIAMGNAIEEIKEKADFVTRTNNHDGIAFALERLIF